MGWKGTKDIHRHEALSLITARISSASNEELSEILTDLGFGDNMELEHFGHNFNVCDNDEELSNYHNESEE